MPGFRKSLLQLVHRLPDLSDGPANLLLLGAVSGPLQIEIGMSQLCPLWNYRRKTIWSHLVIDTYLYFLFYAVSLFIICVSYILIIIKVRCSRHPQFHSRSKRERKLTGTALIVTLVSLLCLLSVMIYGVCLHFSSTCLRNVHMDMGVVVLFLANSLGPRPFSYRPSKPATS
ncbi:hypothetical protein pdam_00024908 [Pocillopora damicornis]|uniref:Uncharacterized protein n=1 Tax=Pocillopora damicornis TaxID=46731 RepID=A0A3M6UKJ7_POCDA|nr:hypothetical protein pdam_00024908 [Pocillopora damicornis]